MSFQVGDAVGDYEIIGLLGAGGMGRVYKVKNTITERVDAMKVLLPNLADDQALADRFMREIKVLASLDHPNIAGLRTAFRLENQLLMIMEYVEGTTLEDRLKQGRIPIAEAIGYIIQVLLALGYAHQRGVIHRDIKPANMMLTAQNQIKLMDFGIAKSKSDRKLTQTGTTMGSLFYMSGEQVQGEDLDGRSDLYSVGVSLYEMVTGARPFQGKSDFDIMIAQLQQAPMPPIELMPEIPKALNDIIIVALAKDRAQRFQTADAFIAALETITASQIDATPVQATTSDLMPTVTAPPPALVSNPQIPAPGVAVGGAVSAPGGYAPITPPPPVAPPADPAHGVPPAAGSKGQSGLLIAVVSLLVLAILVVAAWQVPRLVRSHFGGHETAQATTPPAPGAAQPDGSTPAPGATPQTGDASASVPSGAAPGASVPAGSAPGGNALPTSGPPGSAAAGNAGGNPPTIGPANSAGASPAAASASRGGKAAHVSGKSALNQAAGQAGSQPVVSATEQEAQPSAQAPATQPANSQEMEELEDLHGKLSVRAQSENENVENLRKQMAASGNNLRSDISGAQTRMRMYMDKFDAAMNAGNAAAAKKYMSLAEREVETLEKFFGH
jgi:serine/threonine-protein kinase